MEAIDFIDESSLVYYSLPVTSVTDYSIVLWISFANYYTHVKYIFKAVIYADLSDFFKVK